MSSQKQKGEGYIWGYIVLPLIVLIVVLWSMAYKVSDQGIVSPIVESQKKPTTTNSNASNKSSDIIKIENNSKTIQSRTFISPHEYIYYPPESYLKSVTISTDDLFEEGSFRVKNKDIIKERFLSLNPHKSDDLIEVHIDYHTDNSEKENVKFCGQRVTGIYLVINDMYYNSKVEFKNAFHINFHCFQSKYPIVSNLTAEGRRKNRRVEIKFVYQN